MIFSLPRKLEISCKKRKDNIEQLRPATVLLVRYPTGRVSYDQAHQSQVGVKYRSLIRRDPLTL